MAHMKASNSRATFVTTTCTGFPLAASWRYRFVSRSCAFQRFVERQPIDSGKDAAMPEEESLKLLASD
jgi:hypothetical protein